MADNTTELYNDLTKLKSFIETFRNGNANFQAIKISILIYMYQNKKCLVQELADELKTSRPSAQRQLNALAVDGMVIKDEIYEFGKYKNQYTLTTEAKQFLEKCFAHTCHNFRQGYEAYSCYFLPQRCTMMSIDYCSSKKEF